jgi:hypothetical protein
MFRDQIINDYFEWLWNFTKCRGHSQNRKIITLLHNIEFRYSIPMDANREEDGIDLRYRFITEVGIPKNYQEVYAYLDGPCSVLEMMIALAIRCEESIMDDPDIGDRTSEWFWLMMKNLGLDYMSDRKFDRDIAEEKISIFLDRRYKRNGEGGLFVVNGRRDLRKVEIWYQMCWYLDTIM